MVVRAKFVMDGQKNNEYSGGFILTDYTFHAVYSDDCEENKEFWKWTPAGQIILSSINPEVLKTFNIGDEFYVDFIPVKKET